MSRSSNGVPSISKFYKYPRIVNKINNDDKFFEEKLLSRFNFIFSLFDL